MAWYRSKLKRDRSGSLACPDELPGRDAVTLSEGNAAAASQHKGYTRPRDTGSMDTLDASNLTATHPKTASDW